LKSSFACDFRAHGADYSNRTLPLCRDSPVYKARSASAALDRDHDCDSLRRSKSDRCARAGATKNLRTKIGLMSPTRLASIDA